MGENVRGHNIIIMSVGWHTVLGYMTKSPKKRIIIKRPEVARQRNYNTASGRRSILAFMGVLAALAGPPARAQTWPSPADLRDFALAEAHETKLDARDRRHRPSPGKGISTAFIEDTLAASQFRTIARAAKIGHARQIRIALRVWKPELYAAWRACEERRGARAACPGIELQYAHARTAVSYVLAQREAAARTPETEP